MADASDGMDIVDLTNSPPAPSPTQVVRVEDDDDEDLKLAIALSLQQHEEEQRAAKEGLMSRAEATPTIREKSDQPESGLNGLLALDRRAMEAERLARLKRKRGGGDTEANVNVRSISPQKLRSVSPPALRRATQKSMNPTFERHRLADLSTTRPITTHTDNNSASRAPGTTQSPPQLFPDGIVLKTHAPGYPTERTISFPDLIAPAASLKSCLLSSFIWDFDWLFPHFSTKSTNFLLVMHAKYVNERQQIEADFGGIPNIKLCFPPMNGLVNCMHSKLMLLFFEGRCRIVLPTANLMGFDWGVGSVMENMVWLIDLPVIPDMFAAGSRPVFETDASAGSETRFKKSLKAFLVAQTVPNEVLKKLDKYDFSRTANIGLVHSIGGAHSEEYWRETGHCGLGKTVKEMGLACHEPVEIDFVTSSVGSLNDEFMRSMYLAAQGDDGLTGLTLRTAKTFPATRAGTNSREKALVSKTAGQEWKERFRFYFPSQQVIEASNGGERSAGTICFSEKWWEGDRFPRAAMRDCVSVREGLLMHNKLMFVRFPRVQNVSDAPCIGYVYIGSANLSESAWGRLVQDRATKAPKMNARNWECGVVLQVEARASGNFGLSDERSRVRKTSLGLATFSKTIPLPVEVPGGDYESSSRKPWFFDNGRTA